MKHYYEHPHLSTTSAATEVFNSKRNIPIFLWPLPRRIKSAQGTEPSAANRGSSTIIVTEQWRKQSKSDEDLKILLTATPVGTRSHLFRTNTKCLCGASSDMYFLPQYQLRRTANRSYHLLYATASRSFEVSMVVIYWHLILWTQGQKTKRPGCMTSSQQSLWFVGQKLCKEATRKMCVPGT